EEARAFGALLAVARAGGFRLAPYYEAGELWPRGGPGVAADLEALLDRHGREPGWLRIDGRPVVFVYGSHRVRPRVWDSVRRRLRGGGGAVSLAGAARRPGWIERSAPPHVYTPVPLLDGRRDLTVAYREWTAAARAAGRPFIAPVAPGYDDRP